MRKLSLALSLCLTGCFQSIVGEWELSEYDEDAMEEYLEESTKEESGMDAKINDLDIEFSFTIDEDLEGEGEFEQDAEVTVSSIGESDYEATSDTKYEGELEVEEKEGEFELLFTFSGEIETKLPELNHEENQEVEDVEMELDCTLAFTALTCEEKESDVQMIFIKK